MKAISEVKIDTQVIILNTYYVFIFFPIIIVKCVKFALFDEHSSFCHWIESEAKLASIIIAGFDYITILNPSLVIIPSLSFVNKTQRGFIFVMHFNQVDNIFLNYIGRFIVLVEIHLKRRFDVLLYRKNMQHTEN